MVARGEADLRQLAGRLLAREAGESPDVERLAWATNHALGELRREIVAIIGPAAFRELLTRALRLAAPGWSAVTINPQVEASTCLGGLEDYLRGDDVSRAATRLSEVLASALGVLASLIGDDLTEELIRSAWPGAA